jgi:hypothetical protein
LNYSGLGTAFLPLTALVDLRNDLHTPSHEKARLGDTKAGNNQGLSF